MCVLPVSVGICTMIPFEYTSKRLDFIHVVSHITQYIRYL